MLVMCACYFCMHVSDACMLVMYEDFQQPILVIKWDIFDTLPSNLPVAMVIVLLLCNYYSFLIDVVAKCGRCGRSQRLRDHHQDTLGEHRPCPEGEPLLV